MTREQIINLRAGQTVRTKTTRGMLWRIERVIVPAGGCRVFELAPLQGIGRIYAGTSEIELSEVHAA